jgi:hypothetical protein
VCCLTPACACEAHGELRWQNVGCVCTSFQACHVHVRLPISPTHTHTYTHTHARATRSRCRTLAVGVRVRWSPCAMAMEGVVDADEAAGDGVEGEAALAEFVRQAVRSKREVSKEIYAPTHHTPPPLHLHPHAILRLPEGRSSHCAVVTILIYCSLAAQQCAHPLHHPILDVCRRQSPCLSLRYVLCVLSSCLSVSLSLSACSVCVRACKAVPSPTPARHCTSPSFD